jgi:hypothetical protein
MYAITAKGHAKAFPARQDWQRLKGDMMMSIFDSVRALAQWH